MVYNMAIIKYHDLKLILMSSKKDLSRNKVKIFLFF